MLLNVLYQFNEKYAPFAGVSITSLFENNKDIEEIHVYILGENLSNNSVSKLVKLSECYNRKIIFKDTEKIIGQMKEWKIPSYRGSYAANMRLFLPLILDEQIERILYLDADTVVNGSVIDLCTMDMKEYSIAMALDSLGYNHKLEIGISEETPYYNSGVILFNMNNWIKHDCSNKIIKHIVSGNNSYTSPDQDLLNVVCKNEIMQILPRYNMQPAHLVFSMKDYFKCYSSKSYYSAEQLVEEKQNVKIYHFFRFLGEFPWNKDNLHPDNELFDKYLQLSPWNGYQKEKANASVAMKIEKILYRVLPKGWFLRIFVVAHNMYTKQKAEISNTK